MSTDIQIYCDIARYKDWVLRFIINKLQSFESLIFLLKLTRVSVNASCDKTRGKKRPEQGSNG